MKTLHYSKDDSPRGQSRQNLVCIKHTTQRHIKEKLEESDQM